MPDKPDEEIRKSIKRFEESLPESERNPDAQLGVMLQPYNCFWAAAV